MIKDTRRLILIMAAALAMGCVVTSLNPWFERGRYIHDPALAGTFFDSERGSTWQLSPAAGGGYHLVHTDRAGESASLRAAVAELGGRRFIQFTPEAPELAIPGEARRFQTTWTLARMELDGDRLTLALMDNDWLIGVLDQGDVLLPHLIVDTNVVLTAPTEALERFVAAHADSEEAFPDPITLERR